MHDIAIIGAGISGLAAATFLRDAGLDPLLLEAAAEPGGNVRSDRVDGRVFDRAANGWLDNEPAMARLLGISGLEGEVVRASAASKQRWIWSRGAMHLAPLTPPALLRTGLLSWSAKLRLLAEPLIAPRRDGADETVGEFVRRRLGAGVLDAMVGPMVAGIYAADPDKVSLEAAFPRMVELERDHGSLIRAMIRLGRGGAPSGHLCTLRGGAGALTERLAAGLGDRLRCGVTIEGLRPIDGGFALEAGGEEIAARVVVLACPAPAQARLVGGFERLAAEALAAIPYAPVAVVAGVWPRGAWAEDPRGFGVLMARGEAMGGVLGTLFTSQVFPDQARPDEQLLRTILGGAIHPEVVELDDQQLIERTRRAQGAMFGPQRKEPELLRVYRHPRGIPQYLRGHLRIVSAVREAEHRWPGLFFVGNHLQGIGVKDCARAGERVARAARGLLALGV